MKCPKCSSPHYYVGVLGPDCATVGCAYFKNGKANGVDPSAPLLHEGYVVLRKGRPMPCEEYVFKTREDGERWRSLRGLENALVLLVRCSKPFLWQKSTGVQGIQLADRLYEIRRNAPSDPTRTHAILVDEDEYDGA